MSAEVTSSDRSIGTKYQPCLYRWPERTVSDRTALATPNRRVSEVISIGNSISISSIRLAVGLAVMTARIQVLPLLWARRTTTQEFSSGPSQVLDTCPL